MNSLLPPSKLNSLFLAVSIHSLDHVPRRHLAGDRLPSDIPANPLGISILRKKEVPTMRRVESEVASIRTATSWNRRSSRSNRKSRRPECLDNAAHLEQDSRRN